MDYTYSDDGTETPESLYQLDRMRRERLADLVRKIEEILPQLDMDVDVARNLKQIIREDTFKVLVLGEFKTGKSTFINALLGEPVLPAYAVPCTAVLNEVKWGDNKSAVLYYRDSDVVEEIDVDELEDHVVIKDADQSPYAKVELFWPLELCRNNVEIIDSPGLNEHEVREDVTVSYLDKVDAVLFMFTALQLGPAMTEIEVIESLHEFGHTEIFFVINRFDQLPTDREKEKVKQHGEKHLRPLTERKDAIYFISALDALQGRLEDDITKLTRSSILSLENDLEQFLANERGRIKLMRAASEFRHKIREAQESVPRRENMLMMPLQELEQRANQAEKKLIQLERTRDMIIKQVAEDRSELAERVENRVLAFYRDVEVKIESWIANYEIKSFINPLKMQSEAKRLFNELGEHVRENMRQEFDQWSKDTLRPFIMDEINRLKERLNERTDSFERQITALKLDMSGLDESPAITTDLVPGVASPKSSSERILAAAGGWIIGGPAMAGFGAVFGFDEVVKAFIPQLGAILGAMIIGLPILPVAIVAALVQGGYRTLQLNNRIKEEAAKVYRQKIRERGPEEANKLGRMINSRLQDLQMQLDKGLEIQIDEVRQQVHGVLEEKRKGEQNALQKRSELVEIRKELYAIDSELDSFINDLVSIR